jgi:CYTH domain-containing protein
MPVEIERKFLVASPAWRQAVRGEGLAIRQGYLATGGGTAPVVRIRRAGADAYLTIKGPGGLVRAEFEYPVPADHAEALLALCPRPPLRRQGGRCRSAPALDGGRVPRAPPRLAGLVLAEIELPDEAASPPLPDWLGEEVTQTRAGPNAALSAAE